MPVMAELAVGNPSRLLLIFCTLLAASSAENPMLLMTLGKLFIMSVRSTAAPTLDDTAPHAFWNTVCAAPASRPIFPATLPDTSPSFVVDWARWSDDIFAAFALDAHCLSRPINECDFLSTLFCSSASFDWAPLSLSDAPASFFSLPVSASLSALLACFAALRMSSALAVASVFWRRRLRASLSFASAATACELLAPYLATVSCRRFSAASTRNAALFCSSLALPTALVASLTACAERFSAARS